MLQYIIVYTQSVCRQLSTKCNRGGFFYEPTPLLRDDMNHLSRGFTVQDGNYLSVRWPGDVYRFSLEFLAMMREIQS